LPTPESVAGDRRPFSGPLVKAVVDGVAAEYAPHPRSRVARNALRALLSVPIWLIIVVLSPFDAYSAARAISRE
jgi:hypothetical protein